MIHKLYTIGYQSLRTIKQLKEIAEYRGALVADIRLVAYSPNPMWCTEAMHHVLAGSYRHIHQLGNINYKKEGLPVQIRDFESGFKQISHFIEQCPMLLVCACKSAETCHRSVVADMIAARLPGLEVEHLLSGQILPLGKQLINTPDPGAGPGLHHK